MPHEARVRAHLEAAVRKALEQHRPHAAYRRNSPLSAIRRKHLIQQAKLRASRYGLQNHLDAFIYQAGCEAITGLDHAQLEILDTWLDQLVARADTACDDDGPPAR